MHSPLLASNADIINQIGALELGDHLTSFDDGALEAASGNMAGATQPAGGCPPFTYRCIGDGALFRAAETVALQPPPTAMIPMCRR